MTDAQSAAARGSTNSPAENFVDVALDAEPVTPSQTTFEEAGSLRTSYKRGPRWWKSQIALGALDTSETSESSGPEYPRRRRHSIPGPSGGPDEDTTTTEHNVRQVPQAPTEQEMSLHLSMPMSSTPARKKAEGRYRSRLEEPVQRPTFLRLATKAPHTDPRGVTYDPALEPGVSMTLEDDNGELYVVRSPKPPMSPVNESQPRTTFNLSQIDQALSGYRQHPGFRNSQDTLTHPQNDSLSTQAEILETKTSEDTAKDTNTSPNGTANLQIQHPSLSHDNNFSTKETQIRSTQSDVEPSASFTGKGTPTSLTRMPHLPPKSRKEEARHLADFTAMMRNSKLAEHKREQERHALARKQEEEAIQTRRIWNEEIMPCWIRAQQEPRYKEIWWQGIPQPLRARLWPRASGNNLMLPHDLFDRASKEARYAWSQGIIPTKISESVDTDMAKTLPSLGLFHHKGAPLWQDLRDMLYAYIFVRADEACQRLESGTVDLETLDEQFVLYVPGSASLAAMLLLNLPVSQAFIAMLNIIASYSWLHAIYQLDRCQPDNPDLSHDNQPATKQLQGYERVFNTLLAEQLPTVYANLHKSGIRTDHYLRDWIRTLFVPWLDIDTATRVWDIHLLDKSSATLFRVALALVQLLEPRLYVHDRAELLSILRGNNPGVLHVWHRSLPNACAAEVPQDRIYAQYCIDEKALFRVLRDQEQWWRDSTLRRLLDRELS